MRIGHKHELTGKPLVVSGRGYTERLAREEWTGKHYQSKNKKQASDIAKKIAEET